jgi:hypothetical protein
MSKQNITVFSLQITKTSFINVLELFGWKLTKENVDKLILDMTDALGSIPLDTPVVLFCQITLVSWDWEKIVFMTNFSRFVEGDYGFHVQGAQWSHLTGNCNIFLNRRRE